MSQESERLARFFVVSHGCCWCVSEKTRLLSHFHVFKNNSPPLLPSLSLMKTHCALKYQTAAACCETFILLPKGSRRMNKQWN